jgi:hypothetical protein
MFKKSMLGAGKFWLLRLRKTTTTIEDDHDGRGENCSIQEQRGHELRLKKHNNEQLLDTQ